MEKVYDPIYATELIEMWRCTLGFLNNLYNTGELTPYECEEVRVEPKTNREVAFCHKVSGCLFYGDVAYDPEKIIFPRYEVKMYESKNEEVLWNKPIKRDESKRNKIDSFIDKSTSLGSFFRNQPSDRVANPKQIVVDGTENNTRQKLEQANKEICLLKSKIEELQNNNHEKKARTASACEAAQASRVEVWKGYAMVIAKVAYDCGLEDRKQVSWSG